MGPAAHGFAVLEDRLQETRRTIGLMAADSTPAPSQDVVAAPPALPTRSATTGDVRRKPVGSLVVLGAGWIGLVALVALAL